ncbi:hypothetical protein [Sphingomonas albertensis]|uniref:Uncharacterized protein n=1 Tax=Sphingomonas albertensis TaxID=2762591 RepID=A0ABR7AL54_9SPHN|nr:hypothetical protein [Sphingomonas albertensis]MBC3941180.1 hypothetical protein [Sphingomonas albertensis]
MDDPDLREVDPRRLAETKRRIEIVREYAKIQRPSGADAKLAASALGMSTSNFSRLVKSWREHGRLKAGVTFERRSRAVTSSAKGIPHTSRTAVERAVETAGPMARFTDVVAAAAGACEMDGTLCPSNATIWLIMNDVRSRNGVDIASSSPSILVARCTLDLPVRIGRSARLPHLLFGVALPEMRVISATPVFSHASKADFVSFARDLLSRYGAAADGRPLLADGVTLGEERLPDDLATIDVRHPGSKAFNLLRTAIGSKLDTIGIATPSRTRVPERLEWMRRVDQNEALDAIRHAVMRHNIGRPNAPLFKLRTKDTVITSG